MAERGVGDDVVGGSMVVDNALDDQVVGRSKTAGSMVALVAELAAVDVAAADRDTLRWLAASLGRARGWLDALELAVARRFEEVSSYPEKALADATRSSVRAGERVVQRAKLAEEVPCFEAALAAGSLSVGHVDALGAALRQLEPEQRAGLLGDAERLVEVAASASVEDFTRTLRREAARRSADDGMSRLEQQRRATRLRGWVDAATGMWSISGRFDPVSGVRLHQRLDATLASLFAEQVPETCPTDPGEKQDHLRALALIALTEERGGRPGRPEIIVVVDTSGPDVGQPRVDWGLPVEVPVQVLAELAGTADHHAVVVRNGVVLHAPGTLDLGRTSRLANRAQRRALRALYATCAIPGCAVRYDHCKLHHLHWWEHGGRTDLDNLVPLCERHHHAVHERGWILRLGPNRVLCVALPDGQTMTTGPPDRRAA